MLGRLSGVRVGDESAGLGEPQLSCYQCGELTPESHGALCWVCEDKAAAAASRASFATTTPAVARAGNEPARRPTAAKGSTLSPTWWVLGAVLVVLAVIGGFGIRAYQQQQESHRIVNELENFNKSTTIDPRVIEKLKSGN